ncbi:MAG: hypothetical protein S4CHLAM6_09450 [Chlamydiae bacterium]|nr:hypothetical protein [Chlamydiota bacterium]
MAQFLTIGVTMTVQDCKMTGMPWVSPYLCVLDVDKSVEFYEKAFGFKVVEKIVKNEEGVSVHCELRYQDSVVMLGLQGAWDDEVKAPASTLKTSPISLYVYCSNVDELCIHAEKTGAIVEQKPEDTFWGDRMCRLKDLNGYMWSFATHISSKES